MKKLIIVDVSNFIFRAFYAIRPLHTPEGTPVNAVYGVLSMLHNMIIKHKPTHMLIAKDNKEASFREEIYADYKANRSEPPDDLAPQFGIIDEMIEVLQLPVMKAPKYEADDIIGSVAIQWKDDFDEILIASGDKDLMQFVGGPVKMLDTMKDKIYEREDVKDKMGVYPEQIMDYLSLIGDSSDNIPGVAGIGPKGAQSLLEDFGTLEDILKNIENIKNKRCKTALEANHEMAVVSKKLVRIVTDLNLKFSPADSSFSLTLYPEAEDFLSRMGFKSWVTKLSDYKPKASKEIHKSETPIKKKVSFERWTLGDVKRILQKENCLSVVPLDAEELNQHAYWSGVMIATHDHCGFLTLDSSESKSFVKLLNELKPEVICFQSKPLLQLCLLSGEEPQFKYFDLSQAHFLIDPEKRHDILTIVEEYLGIRLDVPEKSKNQDLFGEVNDETLVLMTEKAQAIIQVYPLLREKMKELEVERPYDDLDIPLIKVLAKMELEGIALDIPFYKELENEFSAQVEEIETEVEKAAGDKINLRSPKQVGELLFEKLQLPIIKKTKTGYSTDAEVLGELAAMDMNPIPAYLLRYREIEKLLSTYVKALPHMVRESTKKIHTHYQPSNAATGRLSSDNPNLQNIPVRTENGRRLRKGFIPSKGRVLLSADYSQVELRLLAHFSQDPGMLEAFAKDLDIHKQTAAEVFEVPLEKVTKEQRNAAKGINFGLMYGQTSFGLSQALHIPQGEAKKYITAYFKKFHSVKSYLDGLKERAEETGYAETLFGRKRFVPDINATNRQVKAVAERVAINSPIQGTAADIIKLAMINIQKILQDQNLKSKMVLQVHDELIFDVEPSELEEMKKIVQQEMENAVTLSVPLRVEMGTGANWYDLK